VRPVYGDLPPEYCSRDGSRIALVPVPYDETSSWIKGAERGPAALIDASANMELYDIETNCEVYRVGIYTDDPVEVPGAPEGMVAAVRERVAGHLEAGRFPVVIGGEHSVALGAVQACAERYPGLSVLQLDAHSDLRQEYLGSRYNHACVMARVAESCPIVQVGIRSMDASERPAMDTARVFFAERIHGRSDWVQGAVELLGPQVYVTLDLDVLDPSVMPSTGTPEPGGLGWYEVLEVVRAVCRHRDVVGFDVVELCPGADRSADFTAAKLVYRMLSYRFCDALKGVSGLPAGGPRRKRATRAANPKGERP
jgi:agmatinase